MLLVMKSYTYTYTPGVCVCGGGGGGGRVLSFFLDISLGPSIYGLPPKYQEYQAYP